MAKYIFTASNGLLVVKLKNIATEFTADESLSFKSPSVGLQGDKVQVYDFGMFEKDFRISEIENINAVIPSSISNAFDLLLALIPAASVGGTISTVTNLTTLQNGQTPHSSSATGNPLRVGGRVLPITPDLTLVSGDASDVGITTAQQALTKDFSPSELDYAFAGSINNSTTPNVFKNAAGASLRNYVTNIILNSDALTSAVEVIIKDGLVTSTSVTANVFTSSFAHDYKIGDQVVFTNIGAYTGIVVNTIYFILTVPSTTTYTLSATPNSTVITIGGTGSATSNRILFRTKLQTASFGPTGFYLPSPLRGAPNATLDFQTVTATTVGVVYYNISGYVGF